MYIYIYRHLYRKGEREGERKRESARETDMQRNSVKYSICTVVPWRDPHSITHCFHGA